MATQTEVQTVTVKLMDSEGQVHHATGQIETRIVADRSLLERNKHLYVFSRMDGQTLIYVETKLAYVVTEF